MDLRKEIVECCIRETTWAEQCTHYRRMARKEKERRMALQALLVKEEARRGTAGKGREAKRGHVAKIQGQARSVKREGLQHSKREQR